MEMRGTPPYTNPRKKMENKKHAFWQAFFVTMLFLLIGFVLGVYLEQIRTDNLSVAFYNSEVSLYDSFAITKIAEDGLASCSELNDVTTKFADRIYEEARELEKFDEKTKLTDSMKSIHRKYDLLRTMLWMNVIDVKTKCPEINYVVYFYVYDSEDIQIKSEQIVWERVLNDLKVEKGNEFILIPIAVDQNIESLNYLISKNNIKDFPAILINGGTILHEPKPSSELENYLN
ncbi:MAG: hypothetical protein AABX93_00825 [Nanoarchaeota archaeon]